MTHTEESLMALADEYARFGDWTGGKPVINEGNERDALRLAIREVLAERDRLDRHMKAMAAIADREKDRAEKAEAECERKQKLLDDAEAVLIRQRDARKKAEAECELLRKDAERYRWLRDGCDNKGTPASWIAQNHYGKDWDAAIDAALKEQP